VIAVSKEELTPGEWSYYTKAAFDFVVCNADKHQSYELIVEYDGIQHEDPDFVLKDSLKDRICIKAGLPILRIGLEDVKPRGNTTLLDLILDQYFGGKEMAALRNAGEVAWDEEYFVDFDETLEIQKRLCAKRLYPSVFSFICEQEGRRDLVQSMYWYTIQDKGLDKFRPSTSSREYWRAAVEVDIFKGLQTDNKIMGIERKVEIRDCNPGYNVDGVHGWHIALELARFLCFKAIEEKWKTEPS